MRWPPKAELRTLRHACMVLITPDCFSYPYCDDGWIVGLADDRAKSPNFMRQGLRSTGREKNWNGRKVVLKPLRQADAVHRSRHGYIREDRINADLGEKSKRLIGILGLDHIEAFVAQAIRRRDTD